MGISGQNLSRSKSNILLDGVMHLNAAAPAHHLREKEISDRNHNSESYKDVLTSITKGYWSNKTSKHSRLLSSKMLGGQKKPSLTVCSRF